MCLEVKIDIKEPIVFSTDVLSTQDCIGIFVYNILLGK